MYKPSIALLVNLICHRRKIVSGQIMIVAEILGQMRLVKLIELQQQNSYVWETDCRYDVNQAMNDARPVQI